jgi:hypothetical protein
MENLNKLTASFVFAKVKKEADKKREGLTPVNSCLLGTGSQDCICEKFEKIDILYTYMHNDFAASPN